MLSRLAINLTRSALASEARPVGNFAPLLGVARELLAYVLKRGRMVRVLNVLKKYQPKRWLSVALVAIAPPAIALSSIAQDARSNYFVLDPQVFTDQFGFAATAPRDLARDLFEVYATESEGRRSESLTITYPSGDTAVVEVEVVGLADDAVAASRYRIELQQTDGDWRVQWVGSQTRCWPGRGHQDWSGEPCL